MPQPYLSGSIKKLKLEKHLITDFPRLGNVHILYYLIKYNKTNL